MLKAPYVGVTSTCGRLARSKSRTFEQLAIRSAAPEARYSGVLATAPLASKDFLSAQSKLIEAIVEFAASSNDQCQTKNF